MFAARPIHVFSSGPNSSASAGVPLRVPVSGAPATPNLAPVLPGATVVLLGEAGKFTALSTHRVARIELHGAAAGDGVAPGGARRDHPRRRRRACDTRVRRHEPGRRGFACTRQMRHDDICVDPRRRDGRDADGCELTADGMRDESHGAAVAASQRSNQEHSAWQAFPSPRDR